MWFKRQIRASLDRANKIRYMQNANVYAILRQREADKADVIKVDKKWGLAEWNPELRPRSNLLDLKKPRKKDSD
jgi:hypothetical protein